MKYLTFDDKTWVIDIETNGLKPTLVWVMVASNMMTGETVAITDEEEMQEWVEEKRLGGCKFVFHNGLHFDGPVLNKLCGTKLSAVVIVDTMLLSFLMNPSLEGGHSLEAWGERLGFPKIHHEDWGELSPEMIERCKGDVEITKRVYGYLCRKLNAIRFSEAGIQLEHYSWVIVREQRLNGFYFDIERALPFHAGLKVVADQLKVDLFKLFPPVLEHVKTYSKARNANGAYSANYVKCLERYERLVELPNGDYEAWEYVEFDPGSPTQRVEKLLALGWKPLEFTKPSKTHPNGQPQPTRKGKLSPSLVAFIEDNEGNEGVRILADWMTVTSRASMIMTWIKAYNEETHCIHGQLWLANTLRYKHSGPNTANAPAVKEGEEKDDAGRVVKKWVIRGQAGGWAYESRDLWTTRDRGTRRLVGVDAKGIQLRVLAHYLNDANFSAAILSEDPHAANAKMMGLPGRGIAKTITYAIVMGAGDARIAAEARITLDEAKANKAKFFEKVPGLPALISKLKGEQRKDGRITLCDGCRILCDQPHTVIPYLLQGDESRIMRKAKTLARKYIREQGLDVLWVGDIHDEFQTDVLEEHVKDFIVICHRAFKEAGEFFKYRLPIECDAKIGFTWAETH